MNAATSRNRALSLFVLGAFVRTCFWLATPDRQLPSSIAYEGDAPKWLQLMLAGRGDIQNALPLHPPGMTWLTPLLTDGNSFVFARFVMVVLGALLAPLLYLLLRRSFSERVAVLTGGLCAVSSGLVVIGSGLHSDIPYLLLFVVGLFPFEKLRKEPSALAAIAFGLLQALACYFRVEHLAFAGLAVVWLFVRTRPHGRMSAVVVATTMIAAFVPWQVHASNMVAAANKHGFPGRPPVVLPMPPQALPWDAGAMNVISQVPAFARYATYGFVNDTIKMRGGTSVTASDLDVLDEAYGYRPEPLSTPLLVMYGPMNFCLANYETSTGMFSRTAFDHRPPLTGGVERYSPMIKVCLEPSGPLRWDYPPHLEIINHGYRIGFERWFARPGWALWLMGQKLRHSWRGIATGVGSYSMPFGMSGVREPVDMTVSMNGTAAVWRALLLALALFGLWTARTACGVVPFVLFTLSKLIAIVLFFGYARMGALCIPSFALLWAVAVDRLVLARMSAISIKRLLWSIVTIVVLVEGVRCFMGESPMMQLDAAPSGPIAGRNERVRVEY
ncbi:MAG: hypothetical protein ACI89X_002763 [Planctomycetota bacterium]|jgi:hypothetical protein